MKMIEWLIKTFKGNDFSIDSRISFGYICGLIGEMIVKIIRGNIVSVFFKKHNTIIFIGKKTKIRGKGKVETGKGVNIGSNVVIDAMSTTGVKLGNNVKIGDFTRILTSGSLRKIGVGIQIGNNCGIGEYCFFGAAGGIKIGNDVIMGQNVRFHSENHNYSDVTIPIRMQGVTNKGIEVGDDCWIGAGAVILDGVKIGSGSVIGANTVVNKSIPARSIAVGAPAKVIKIRE